MRYSQTWALENNLLSSKQLVVAYDRAYVELLAKLLVRSNVLSIEFNLVKSVLTLLI